MLTGRPFRHIVRIAGAKRRLYPSPGIALGGHRMAAASRQLTGAAPSSIQLEKSAVSGTSLDVELGDLQMDRCVLAVLVGTDGRRRLGPALRSGPGIAACGQRTPRRNGAGWAAGYCSSTYTPTNGRSLASAGPQPANVSPRGRCSTSTGFGVIHLVNVLRGPCRGIDGVAAATGRP